MPILLTVRVTDQANLRQGFMLDVPESSKKDVFTCTLRSGPLTDSGHRTRQRFDPDIYPDLWFTDVEIRHK